MLKPEIFHVIQGLKPQELRHIGITSFRPASYTINMHTCGSTVNERHKLRIHEMLCHGHSKAASDLSI